MFITLAFAGTMTGEQLTKMIITQWLIKCTYEILATPATYAVVGFLKRVEHEDFFDYDTDFSPFRLQV